MAGSLVGQRSTDADQGMADVASDAALRFEVGDMGLSFGGGLRKELRAVGLDKGAPYLDAAPRAGIVRHIEPFLL